MVEPLLVHPVVDDADLAAARRVELGVPAALGRSAAEAIERGYVDAEGRRVDWGDLVATAVAAKALAHRRDGAVVGALAVGCSAVGPGRKE